jgi:hypothetical protein
VSADHREPPLRIADREQLVFVLCEAAELEHSLTCAYLFAAWSLRTGDDDGLPPDQLVAVRRWERAITAIAVQEMGHLALVSNLLTALGAAPHLARPNLPQRSRYYPEEIQLSLEPFNAATLRHFIHLERPEGMDEPDAPEFQPPPRPSPSVGGPETAGRVIPRAQPFATVGHLYREIGRGFEQLVSDLGEEAVFLGSPRAQATTVDFALPELLPVTDLTSALEVVELIVEEGEGARGAWEHAHYGRFLAIERELEACTADDPAFAPAFPVLANPFVHQPFDCDPVNVLTDPFTVAVADLANGAYATMLQILARSFAHTNETDLELSTLATTSVDAMFRLLAPLGRLLTRMPAGPDHPGRTAGMSFELYRSLHLLPHRRAAWALMCERLSSLAGHADDLAAGATVPDHGQVLSGVSRGLHDLAAQLRERMVEHVPYSSGPRLPEEAP